MVDLHVTVPISTLPALAARSRGAVTILNLHDFYPHASRYKSRLVWIERTFFRWSYRRFDLIAAMTRQQLQRLVADAGVHPRKLMAINHGLFSIAGIRPPTKEPTRILLFGSLRSNKRVFESIRAVRLLGFEGHNIRLRIAGAPRPEEANYWGLCQSELVDIQGVEVLDRFIEENELPDVLSGVDAILCPYENFDSASGVGILAVSNGIPLIATQAAVPAQLEKECSDYIKVEQPVTPISIAEAIRRFLNSSRDTRLQRAALLAERMRSESEWRDSIRTISQAVSNLDSSDGDAEVEP
jgi:glycosyltransferase involved in cell wall biosynthesis